MTRGEVSDLSNRERSGRVLDSRPRGRGFEPHCVVSLSKNIIPSLVLVLPRKTRPFITERLLMGRKESNQKNQMICQIYIQLHHASPLYMFLLRVIFNTRKFVVAIFALLLKHKDVKLAWRLPNYCNVSSWRNTLNLPC